MTIKFPCGVINVEGGGSKLPLLCVDVPGLGNFKSPFSLDKEVNGIPETLRNLAKQIDYSLNLEISRLKNEQSG